jgi:uncharacterized membrane protein YeaQ/YmgE (transglycosylase-associated protein family)
MESRNFKGIWIWVFDHLLGLVFGRFIQLSVSNSSKLNDSLAWCLLACAGRKWSTNTNAEEDIMSIIGWILFGLVVGIIGKLLMPGRDPGGFVITILLGIAGALLGGFVGQALGLYEPGEPAGFIMAVLGSIVLRTSRYSTSLCQ